MLDRSRFATIGSDPLAQLQHPTPPSSLLRGDTAQTAASWPQQPVVSLLTSKPRQRVEFEFARVLIVENGTWSRWVGRLVGELLAGDSAWSRERSPPWGENGSVPSPADRCGLDEKSLLWL